MAKKVSKKEKTGMWHFDCRPLGKPLTESGLDDTIKIEKMQRNRRVSVEAKL